MGQIYNKNLFEKTMMSSNFIVDLESLFKFILSSQKFICVVTKFVMLLLSLSDPFEKRAEIVFDGLLLSLTCLHSRTVIFIIDYYTVISFHCCLPPLPPKLSTM